jgi:hypothetical protein
MNVHHLLRTRRPKLKASVRHQAHQLLRLVGLGDPRIMKAVQSFEVGQFGFESHLSFRHGFNFHAQVHHGQPSAGNDQRNGQYQEEEVQLEG